MEKTELIDLHEAFVSIVQTLENDGVYVDTSSYDALDLSPDDEHRRKTEHKAAVFRLGEAVADAIGEDEFSEAGRLAKRMSEIDDEIPMK